MGHSISPHTGHPFPAHDRCGAVRAPRWKRQHGEILFPPTLSVCPSALRRYPTVSGKTKKRVPSLEHALSVSLCRKKRCLASSVQLLCQLRLLAGSCILVHQTLCASLINTLDGSTYCDFLISCASCTCSVSLLDHSLQVGLASLVCSSLCRNNLNTLFCRTNIRHNSYSF